MRSESPAPEPPFSSAAPSTEATNRLWNEVRIEKMELRHPAVEAYMDALKGTMSKQALGSFSVTPHPTLDWFVKFHLLNRAYFFRRILESPAVTDALPDLNSRTGLEGYLGFQETEPLLLDGLLAIDLVSYISPRVSFHGGSAEAKQLARDFCVAMFGDRFGDVQAYHSRERWSDWFHPVPDVAWHSSWMILDTRDHRVWILCKTDKCP